MEHKKDKDLHQFLNFELSSEEEKAFKKSDEYQKHKEILDLFENTKAVPFDESALMANINAKKHVKTKVIPLYKKWWSMSAVASILLFCSMLYFYSVKPISYETVVAESLQFSLPDESEVWLNAKSEISYNKDWENSRDIELNGEAYFEVAKGKKFTVKTPQGSVSVLGTKFNVKQREGFFEVHCFEGSVAVVYNNNETVLKPNDTFTSKSNKTEIHKITKPNWISKKSVFNGTTLNEVLIDISLHYDVIFEQNPKLKELSLNYTGSYNYSDDLTEVLNVLCKSLNLNFKNTNNIIHLSINNDN